MSDELALVDVIRRVAPGDASPHTICLAVHDFLGAKKALQKDAVATMVAALKKARLECAQNFVRQGSRPHGFTCESCEYAESPGPGIPSECEFTDALRAVGEEADGE